MTLPTGLKLGSYEIVTPIGSGGMGEVYRARDIRLGREVAIKVIPAGFAGSADRLHRFEQEARASGMLNHPNLLTIYDIGTHEGAPYIVSELLEGETLRDRLAHEVAVRRSGDASGQSEQRPSSSSSQSGAALAARKAVDYGIQIAQGLAAAHDKGIIHRDLKPENLFLTRDGRIKILDFGLAKLTDSEDSATTGERTAHRDTAPGTVMGTAGYMSPEQVRAQPVDHRSDIFSFGAILYEMLSGRRAFSGSSSVETMNAILKEDPPEMAAGGRDIPPGLQKIVDHCLDKNPEGRFQSARDLAFNLEAVSTTTGSGSGRAAAVAGRRWSWPVLAAVLAVVLLVIAAAVLVGHRRAFPDQPVIHQLTYQRGSVRSARFGPDGQTVLYGAAWNGEPLKIFQTRVDALESTPLSLPDGDILSIAAGGDTAVSIGRKFDVWVSQGTLALSNLVGATSRPMLEHVNSADFAPDGKQLAIIRLDGQASVLEFPIGKPLARTEGYFSHLRVSPDGKEIALLDHPFYGDNRGFVSIVGSDGKLRHLTSEWAGLEGLAWSPDGGEVWFTGDPGEKSSGVFALYAVNREGRLRSVWQVPTNLVLLDVARNGKVLLTSGGLTGITIGKSPEAAAPRDLTWLAWSSADDISRDGKYVAMTSYGPGSSRLYTHYLRPTDGSPATRLGEGSGLEISPDNRWIAVGKLSDPPTLLVEPTGPGQPRLLASAKDIVAGDATWFADSRHLLVSGAKRGGPVFTVYDIEDPKATRTLTVTGAIGLATRGAVSPDGRWFLCGDDTTRQIVPTAGGAARPIAVGPQERIAGWTEDSRQIFVGRRGASSFHVDKLDVFTGVRTPVGEYPYPDLTGSMSAPRLRLSRDGRAFVSSVGRFMTDLYLVEGLR